MNAAAAIGHNQPADPFTAFSLHADDLDEQARQFLDGATIETEAQAEDVSRLLNMARKASNDAEDARKIEKKPHDDAAAEVQAKWKPLLGKLDLIVNVAKKASAQWLVKTENEKRAAVEAANVEAERLAAAARTAAEEAAPTDLAGQATARILQENAAAAAKQATRLDRKPVQARGGERAVSLRSVWTPTLTEPVAALKHYRETQPDALKAWLIDQARQDVRAGKRSIPGFTITEEKVAV